MNDQLKEIMSGKTLTHRDAGCLMGAISTGELNASQMAALLTAIGMRAVTPEELEGFRDAIMKLGEPSEIDFSDCVDVCGTGGDSPCTFNISTVSAFVAAGAGIRIAKHGNYGFSSRCGSSQVLEAVGIRFSAEVRWLRQEVDEANICFLHAPLFLSAFRLIQPVRRELGFRTFFNVLGPLVNPVRPGAQLLGVPNLELARAYSYVLQKKSGTDYTIVHSLDGYDEVSLTGVTRLMTPGGSKDVLPEEFGFPTLNPAELRGGESIAEAAKIFMNILAGAGTDAQRAVTVANAALAIQMKRKGNCLEECVSDATESLESGRALRQFEILRRLSSDIIS